MAVDAKTRALQVLADLYPDQTARDAAVAGLGDAGLQKLGENVLRRDDHSREMNELGSARTALAAKEAEAQALYDSNKAWFDQKQAELAELDQLRQRVAGGQPTPPVKEPTTPDVMTKDLFEKAMADTERGAVAFMTDLNRLSLEHFQRFGEILDTETLLRNPKVQQVGLRGIYGEVFKPRLDELAAKARQEAEDKIRLDERTKVLQAQASQHHPYPVRGNEPSTLDALERAADPARPAAKTVDDMVNEYARLTASRTGLST